VLIFNGCSATPPCHSLKEAGPIPWPVQLLAPLAATAVPLQPFAYHIAVARGCDVDKPRNLARSVTVE